MKALLKDLIPCFHLASTFGPDKRTHARTPHARTHTLLPQLPLTLSPAPPFYLTFFFPLQDMCENVKSRPVRPLAL